LIAHELAHSWSGNLVTNRSWDSFWLNEGFTSYVENRIVEAVYGKPQALMEQALSQDKLKRELEELPAADQRLLLDLRGRDPDLGMTAVAYDKGHWFLRFLEQRFGRKAFDAFLKRYFEHFAFSSIASEDFVSFLKRELMAKDSGKLSEDELRTWLEQPGIPDFAEVATSARFAKIDLAIRAYANTEASAVSLKAKRWSVQEWLRFLEGLPTLSAKRLAVLDQAYQLSKSGNSEIAHAFFLQAIKSDYQEVYPALERYLIAIGRRKLVLPLYEALAKSEGGRERAREIYRKARDGYHPITRASIDAVVLPRSQ
jgi:aminopeptidase N